MKTMIYFVLYSMIHYSGKDKLIKRANYFETNEDTILISNSESIKRQHDTIHCIQFFSTLHDAQMYSRDVKEIHIDKLDSVER